MDADSTERLLEEWQAGDPDALTALLEQNLDWLTAKVRHKLGQHMRRLGDTTGFVNEAVVDFLRYSPSFRVRNRAQLRALLVRVLESAICDEHAFWFQSRKRSLCAERLLSSDSVVDLTGRPSAITPPERRAERAEMEARMRLAMELLDPEDRRVLVLRHWEGRDFETIAATLGVSLSASYKRYERALPRLARQMDRLARGEV